MLHAFSTPRNRTRTLVILIVCAVLAIAAAVVGISDNPPGILLAYLAAAAFVLAFVHPWRRPGRFWWLFFASLLGFVVFAFLHNALEAFAGRSAGPGILRSVATWVSVGCFLLAVLLCPPGVVVGLIGALVSLLGRRPPAGSALRPAEGQEQGEPAASRDEPRVVSGP